MALRRWGVDVPLPVLEETVSDETSKKTGLTSPAPSPSSATEAKASSDTRIEELLYISPHIKTLRLDGYQVTDAGMKFAGQFKELTHLTIHRTRLTNAGLAQLHQLATLKSLQLWRHTRTPQQIAKLQTRTRFKELIRQLDELNRLNSDASRPTPEQIDRMAAYDKGWSKIFARENEIDLANSKLTDQAIKKLDKSLPQLKITRQ